MPAAAIAVSPHIDFNNRVSALIEVGNAINANLTYWGTIAAAVPRAAVPAQSAANSRRRYTDTLNSYIAAVGGAYTAFAMSPPTNALKQYATSDYNAFQPILAAIIAQNNVIATAHA